MNLKVKIERMHPLNSEGPTKAFCDLLLQDAFVIKGLKVIKGTEGLFVGMPSSQGKDGKWYDSFHPISKEIKQNLEKLVLKKYNEIIG